MCQRNRLLFLGLLSVATLLVMVEKSSAQFYGNRRFAVRRPYFPANRMPGWDWRRTYPWSAYNYGRNPYNPIIMPYAYPQPYPIYTPVPVGEQQGFVAQSPGSPPQQEEIPHPTGAINVPPANAALIEIQVPTEFAQVWFDNESSSSIGTSRYYVTPDLPAGKECHYDIKASWNVNGQVVTQERKITVQAGQTSKVDFTKPASK
jgi:uncharacterized protein (TIGR03000 family)